MVNEYIDINARVRTESDVHRTFLRNDPFLPEFIALLGSPHAQCSIDLNELWRKIDTSPTRCTGEVSLWKDPGTRSILRLGGDWTYLQLYAYSIAYPDLTTTAAGHVIVPREPG